MSLLPATAPMRTPARPSVAASPYRCGWDPLDGASCESSNGRAADAWELRKASRWTDPGPRRVSQAEWDRLLTGRPAEQGRGTA